MGNCVLESQYACEEVGGVKMAKTILSKVSNIAPVKGMIGKKRIDQLKKAVENRNRRVRYTVKKMTGEWNEENYLKLVRGQYVPPAVRVDFSKITSLKDYNALMRMLEADKTREWKDTRLNNMRNWLANSIKRSIWIDESDDPELFEKIYSMSEQEILRYRMDHPELIKEIFEYYVDDQAIDADDRDYMWNRMRKALGLKGEKTSDVFAI